jgi:alpha-N-arabinofuranosidase
MTPTEYCTQYRRFATYLRGFGDTKPYLIACGPNKNDSNWTETFLQNMRRTVPSGFSMHFYSNSKAFATKFTVEDMQTQFATFPQLEKAVIDQRALMDKYDAQKRVGLILDEWGVWDRMVPEEEKSHGRLWQQITMRSAVAGALGLNVFQRQADKLVMCNIAQMVNVLHSLLLTDNDRCVRTTTYWVYDMMKRQRSQMSVKVDQPESGVSVSASTKGKELVLTCVNPKHDATVRLNCPLSGAKAAGGKGRVLHDGDLNAANTFDHPDRIMSKECAVEASGSNIRIELPPLSVLTAVVQLS